MLKNSIENNTYYNAHNMYYLDDKKNSYFVDSNYILKSIIKIVLISSKLIF